MSRKIVLDGRLVEGDSVSMVVRSGGFAYGYGVFETIKFFNGIACYFSEHVRRLSRAASEARLDCELDFDTLKKQALLLFEANEVDSGVFKIVVYEGVDQAHVVLFVRTFGIEESRTPLRLRLSPAVVASKAFTSRYKTLNYMETVRDMKIAHADGFDECVYRNEHGFLTECSVSSLFWVSKGTIKTPRLECGLLDGIVRSRLIRIACSMGYVVEEGDFPVDNLLEAKEAFVTNSGVGVRAVSEFDDGDGRNVLLESKLCHELAAVYLEQERLDLAYS